MNNVRVGIELQLLLLGGSLAGVGRGEDGIKFLECAVLGLGDEEVDDDSLHGAPHTEDDVSLPADVLEGDRESKLVDKST